MLQGLGESGNVRGLNIESLSSEEAERLEVLREDLEIITAPVGWDRELLDLQAETRRMLRVLSRLGGRLASLGQIVLPEGDPPPIRSFPTRLRRLLLIALEQVLLSAEKEGDGRMLVQVLGAGDRSKLRMRLEPERISSPKPSVRKPKVPRALVSDLDVEWTWRLVDRARELTLSFPPYRRPTSRGTAP